MITSVLLAVNLIIIATLANASANIPAGTDRLSCTATPSSGNRGDYGCLLENDTSFRFFLLGDTGGVGVYPYYTKAQTRVAKQIREIADERKTQFQFLLGDNFYYYGVESVDSERFKTSFEDVYQGDSLTTPWYVVAGNHDHRGSVDAQIQYTNRSSRWTMPDLYYAVKYQLPNGVSMEVLMVDTVTLIDDLLKSDEPPSLVEQLLSGKDRPTAQIKPKIVRQAAAADQWKWIEQKLSESTADYLFVMGHHPIYAVGHHGPNEELIKGLKPLLQKYKATAFVNGHNHRLEYLQEPGSSLAYVISGAASRIQHDDDYEDEIPEGSLKLLYPAPRKHSMLNMLSDVGLEESGFVYTIIDGESGRGVFEFYDENAKLLRQFGFVGRNRKQS